MTDIRQPMRKPSSESNDRLSLILKFKNPGERFDWSIDREDVCSQIADQQFSSNNGLLRVLIVAGSEKKGLSIVI